MPNRPPNAVLGFRPHTYWTSAVALAGPRHAPRVIERRRIPFAAGEERSAFHRAEQTDLESARALIEGVRVATEANAAREIGQFIADLQRDSVTIRTAVVPEVINKLPDNLEDILKMHARMLAATGNFYRGVVASACGVLGLQVHRAVERELTVLVGDRLDETAAVVEARLKAMGRALGPPWTEDYQLATLAAWLHLDDTDEDD